MHSDGFSSSFLFSFTLFLMIIDVDKRQDIRTLFGLIISFHCPLHTLQFIGLELVRRSTYMYIYRLRHKPVSRKKSVVSRTGFFKFFTNTNKSCRITFDNETTRYRGRGNRYTPSYDALA